MSQALVIVDVQNDFCEGGALGVNGGNAVAKMSKKLILDFADNGDAIYATRDWHPEETKHFDAWVKHCIQGTPGARFHEAIAELVRSNAVKIVSKGTGVVDDGYSAFEGYVDNPTYTTPFISALRARNISELVVAGIATDYCVKATVLDALHKGFKVTVIADAIAGVAPDTTADALAQMRAAGAAFVTYAEFQNKSVGVPCR